MREGARDGGQSTVELALVLPFLVLAVLMVVQLAVVVRDRIAVGHVARVAARAAVVETSAAAVRRAAIGSTPLDPGRLEVVVRGGAEVGARFTVEVRYRSVTEVPLAGALLGDVTMEERLTAVRG